MSRSRKALRGAARSAVALRAPLLFHIHHPMFIGLYAILRGKEARRGHRRLEVRFGWLRWRGTLEYFPLGDFGAILNRLMGPHRRGEESRGEPPRGRLIHAACKRRAGWAVELVRAGKIDVPRRSHHLTVG